MQKKIRIEINLLIFDTKLFFNTYPNAFAARRGGCVMLVARLCQGRASCFFKSCFNLFWKSVFCHRKSNHTVLCTSGLENPSVSFNMEMLLALTLPSGGVVHDGKRSRRSSLLLPAILASWTTIFPPFLCLNLVFWWFADTSLASHINSNSMTRCLLHFSQHPLQPWSEMLTPAAKGSYACPANYLKQIAKTLSHAGLEVTMLAAKMLPQDPGQMSLGFLTFLWDGQRQGSVISSWRKCVAGTQATVRPKMCFLVAPSPRGMQIPAMEDVPKEEDFM